MATDRRVSRVAASIKREISQMLMQEIKDDRVGTGMVSVTEVIVSGDLQHAKIFVSIYGSEEAKATTLEGLASAKGYVRSELGRRMRLRRTPEISFLHDLSLERGTNMVNLLNQLSYERSLVEANAEQDSTMELDDELDDELDNELDDELDKELDDNILKTEED